MAARLFHNNYDYVAIENHDLADRLHITYNKRRAWQACHEEKEMAQPETLKSVPIDDIEAIINVSIKKIVGLQDKWGNTHAMHVNAKKHQAMDKYINARQLWLISVSDWIYCIFG